MAASRLRFGVFEIDLAGRELRRQGSLVSLQEQPFTVLALLVSRAGEVVSREELRRAVWPDGTFVDFDRGLNFCVSCVRRTLGDDASRPLYVETLPRRGYRFVAPVSVVETGTITTPAAAPRVARAPGVRRAVLAAVLLLATATVPGGVGGRPSATHALTPPSGPARASYLRGLHLERSPGGAAASLASFQEAATLEPASPAVQVALGRAWLRAVQDGRLRPDHGMPRAENAGRSALRTSESAEAHLVLATVALRYHWQWDAAQRHVERALELDPYSAPAHLLHADLLLVRGRTADAVAAAGRAAELDPLCPVVRGDLARSYYAARRFDEASVAWAESASVAPDLVGPHERLVHAHRQRAAFRAAAAEAGRVVELLGLPRGTPATTELRAREDVHAFVRGTLAYLQQEARRAPALVADRMAVLHAVLGERDAALRWLRVAYHEKSGTLPQTALTDPDLDVLRSDPAFRALLSDLQL